MPIDNIHQRDGQIARGPDPETDFRSGRDYEFHVDTPESPCFWFYLLAVSVSLRVSPVRSAAEVRTASQLRFGNLSIPGVRPREGQIPRLRH